MSNHSKESIMDFLRRHAPKAPISECMSIASDFESLKWEEFHYKEAIALLSEVVGLDEQGGFKDVARKYKDCPAILWALDRVSYCNAWVECGPMANAMDRLKERVAENIKNKKLQLGVSKNYLRQFSEEEAKEPIQ